MIDDFANGLNVGDGEIRLQGLNLPAHAGNHRLRLARRLHLKGSGRRIILRQRQIHERWRNFSNGIYHAVSCDPHDFAQHGVAKEMEPLADGILIGPELLGHGFVNDGYARCPLAVRIGEEAATDER